MSWFDKMLKYFTIKDSESYCEVIDRINRIKKGIGDVNLTRPGCEQSQIVLTDNNWTVIKEDIGKNIRMIGLEFSNDYKITYNELIDGKLFNHKHAKYYELIYLVSGELSVIINNQTYTLNDTNRSILVNKGTYHEISGVNAKFVTYYSLTKDILTSNKPTYKPANIFG